MPEVDAETTSEGWLVKQILKWAPWVVGAALLDALPFGLDILGWWGRCQLAVELVR
jgi:hypothetical protein